MTPIDRTGIRTRFRLGLFGLTKRALAAVVLLAAGTGGVQAGSADKVFTIANYPVEARAGDAVAAKERAIADGQQAAFRSLLKRIVPVTSFRQIARLKSVRGADLIDGLAVRSERNSSTEYIATYDFAFRPEAVRRVLDREGIPFFDRQAPAAKVVTVYRVAKGQQGLPETFSETRGSDLWLYAWKGLDLTNSLTPLVVEPAKREVHVDTVTAIASGDPVALRALASEHRAETILMALLEPDYERRRITVTLAGRDAVAPFILKRSYRLEGGDLAYTAELAAVISLSVLEGRWKAINVRVAAAPLERRVDSQAGAERSTPEVTPAAAMLNINVRFGNMQEWQRISRQLSQTPEVSDLDVQGLGGRSARLTLRYPSGPQSLALVLAQSGLILQQSTEGWVLTGR